jgi:hypothetical protein
MWHVFHQDVPVPQRVTILDTDFTEARPHVRQGDSVLRAEFLVEDSEQRYVMLVEAQWSGNEDKKRSWPYYVAYLHDKYDCPVVLLVVCNDTATARWARKPLTIGLPGVTALTLTASVLGPDNLGPITDPAEAAEDVGLAVLAAITNSKSEQIGDILEALADALDTIDTKTAETLAGLTASGLTGTDGQMIWRTLMTTSAHPYTSPLHEWLREAAREEVREEVREAARVEVREAAREEARTELLEAERNTVRLVIKARGFSLSDAQAKLVSDCTGLDTLKAWSEAAVSASTVDDIFG